MYFPWPLLQVGLWISMFSFFKIYSFYKASVSYLRVAYDQLVSEGNYPASAFSK